MLIRRIIVSKNSPFVDRIREFMVLGWEVLYDEKQKFKFTDSTLD